RPPRLRPPAVVSRRSPGVVPQSSSVSRVMLSLPRPVHDERVAYCLVGLPDEACGLLGGNPGTGEAVTCYPTRNLAASAKLYTVDPKEHLRADRAAEAAGNSIIGVFHSHTHTEAYPSPTDVPRPPIPLGTTYWFPSGTFSRWSGAIELSTQRSPKNRSGCSPGRIPTEVVNFFHLRSPGTRGEPVSVQVNLPTVLRSHAGGAKTVSAEGSTVGQVLVALAGEYPGLSGQVIDD